MVGEVPRSVSRWIGRSLFDKEPWTMCLALVKLLSHAAVDIGWVGT